MLPREMKRLRVKPHRRASELTTRRSGSSAPKWRRSLRTSIVTDPPDGRIPALTPVAEAERRRRQDLLRHPGGSRELGLQDQCILFPTAVPPMIPYSYNSNYQMVQTGQDLMINVEMIHDTRIIPLDGRPHRSSKLRLWLGDSVGHWEGGTLVVDTVNFNDAGGFYGDAGGMYGWDRNLHVVERFSLLDANTIRHRFEVDLTAVLQRARGRAGADSVADHPGRFTNTPATKAVTRCRDLLTSSPRRGTGQRSHEISVNLCTLCWLHSPIAESRNRYAKSRLAWAPGCCWKWIANSANPSRGGADRSAAGSTSRSRSGSEDPSPMHSPLDRYRAVKP